MIYDLIKQQRLIVKANILKSFLTDEEIEKAQYRQRGDFKYLDKHISKTGRSIVYEYEKDGKIEKIKGETDVKTKRGKRMETTIDKEGKSLLIYNEDDIKKTEDLLSNIPGIEDIISNKSEDKSSSYFTVTLNKQRYKIRMSNHPYLSPADKVVMGCYYQVIRKGVFNIEASIGKYKPEEIPIIIQGIDKNLRKFRASKNKKIVKDFINKNLSRVGGADDLSYIMYPHDASMDLADLYINENNIKDDKYGTIFHALCCIIFDELPDE